MAKEAQSEVEQEAISDFAGNGSAAIKKGQVSGMKDISGSLSSGLDGGGSVSGALGVMSSNSEFWQWFTQDNSNNINNLYSPSNTRNTKKLKSVNNDPGWDIIDAYSLDQEEFYRRLNNESSNSGD